MGAETRWPWESAEALRPLVVEDDAYERALAIETCPPHWWLYGPGRITVKEKKRYRVTDGVCRKCGQPQALRELLLPSWHESGRRP